MRLARRLYLAFCGTYHDFDTFAAPGKEFEGDLGPVDCSYPLAEVGPR
jgi:hypothetical protein